MPQPLDTATVTEEVLCQVLRKFYGDVTRQTSDVGAKRLCAAAQSYHKNSLKNTRSGLHSPLADPGRNIDIVLGTSFKSANRILDGFQKEQTKVRISRPTEHKPVIEHADLQRISNYFSGTPQSPVIQAMYLVQLCCPLCI